MTISDNKRHSVHRAPILVPLKGGSNKLEPITRSNQVSNVRLFKNPWILVPNPVNDYDDQVFDDDEQIDVEGNIDSALADTLDQLTAETLNRLPRHVAIDGILAFGEFKNN